MAKKDRLKNGLDMLFDDNFADESYNDPDDQSPVQTLRLSLVEPDKKQPRTNFDESKLRELADNIERHGILQPILVRPGKNGSYKIIAGERRWRAARLAGLTEVPVVIKELDDFEAAQISLIENIQREDLDPIEEAAAYKRLLDEFGMTQETLSASVGKSRAAISNSVRMLKLPDEMQKALVDRRLTPGHAKILCGIENNELQKQLFDFVIDTGATVRQLESALSQAEKPSADKPSPEPKKPERYDEFKKYATETALSFKQIFGVNVKVEKEKKGYSMKFSFKNEDELRSLVEELSKKLG